MGRVVLYTQNQETTGTAPSSPPLMAMEKGDWVVVPRRRRVTLGHNQVQAVEIQEARRRKRLSSSTQEKKAVIQTHAGEDRITKEGPFKNPNPSI